MDFNEITLLTEPIQIVGILNSIYNLLDSRIECYDVYKVNFKIFFSVITMSKKSFNLRDVSWWNVLNIENNYKISEIW